jgi:hypothetical protein
MAEFIVDADVMARARFGTSQLAETLAALRILHSSATQPWYRHWRSQHLTAFRDRLHDDPVASALVAAAFGPRWTADFLTVPPAVPDLGLDEELVHLEDLPDDQLRTDLEVVRHPLPPELTATGLATTAADLLRWIWTTTVAPEWPRRSQILRADIVSRTSRLGTHGWSGVLEGLSRGVRWIGPDRLQVNEHPFPAHDIRGRDLMFIAAHSSGGWVSWRLPDRYAVTYPVTGILATNPAPDPQPLARLIGPTRTQILLHAEHPISTSALAATCQLPLGSVGDHLRVLLDAGLLERRRSSREVLYWWSPTTHALINN